MSKLGSKIWPLGNLKIINYKWIWKKNLKHDDGYDIIIVDNTNNIYIVKGGNIVPLLSSTTMWTLVWDFEQQTHNSSQPKNQSGVLLVARDGTPLVLINDSHIKFSLASYKWGSQMF